MFGPLVGGPMLYKMPNSCSSKMFVTLVFLRLRNHTFDGHISGLVQDRDNLKPLLSTKLTMPYRLMPLPWRSRDHTTSGLAFVASRSRKNCRKLGQRWCWPSRGTQKGADCGPRRYPPRLRSRRLYWSFIAVVCTALSCNKQFNANEPTTVVQLYYCRCADLCNKRTCNTSFYLCSIFIAFVQTAWQFLCVSCNKYVLYHTCTCFQMIMIVGLPGSGKTTWGQTMMKQYPYKRYNIVGTDTLIDKMKVLGLPRRNNYHGRWEVLIQKATNCLNKLFQIGRHFLTWPLSYVDCKVR